MILPAAVFLLLFQPGSAATASGDSSKKCMSHHEAEQYHSASHKILEKWNSLASTLSSDESGNTLEAASNTLDSIDSDVQALKANLTGITCFNSGESQVTNATISMLDIVRNNLDQYLKPVLTSTAGDANSNSNSKADSASQGYEDVGIEDHYTYQGGRVTEDKDGSESSGRASPVQPQNGYAGYPQPQYGQPSYPQYGYPGYAQPQYGQPNYQPQYGQPNYQQPQYGQQYGGYGPYYNQAPNGYSQNPRGGIRGIPERVLRFTERLVQTLFNQLEEIGSIFTISGNGEYMEIVKDTEQKVHKVANQLVS